MDVINKSSERRKSIINKDLKELGTKNIQTGRAKSRAQERERDNVEVGGHHHHKDEQ